LKKILIVEDERILAVSLRMDLNEMGFLEVTIASNCDDALEAVRNGKADLALMDISINGDKTGIETAILIAQESLIPVIFVTGETDEATKAKAYACPNFKGYLMKPVRVEMLHLNINEAFSLTIS